MEIVFLILILGIFMIPSLLMARQQKKRQSEVVALQNSVQPGDQIVTVSGFHATIVDTHDSVLTLELAPGVHATMERAGVMRKVEEVEPPAGGVPGSAGDEWDNYPTEVDDRNQHPENFPSDRFDPDNDEKR
ncbi:preprotein translocase subunit YajC [Corynebacterium pilosum]|uniref:Preprotein translocase subunit YajC n=2 Tax=Corynebacterium pilosum TaxID=35756 RepID=A0A376CQ48_9CORY|nr:preprotein translocase subunit YajC [Corynebacterium pilosum]STC70570.1 preprotein translocase subunit YajC [Corynebacterium pilosum]